MGDGDASSIHMVLEGVDSTRPEMEPVHKHIMVNYACMSLLETRKYFAQADMYPDIHTHIPLVQKWNLCTSACGQLLNTRIGVVVGIIVRE